jgi:hypothetical protein
MFLRTGDTTTISKVASGKTSHYTNKCNNSHNGPIPAPFDAGFPAEDAGGTAAEQSYKHIQSKRNTVGHADKDAA